jgi:hypothetical protein
MRQFAIPGLFLLSHEAQASHGMSRAIENFLQQGK